MADYCYAEIERVPFKLKGSRPVARLVPSKDRSHVVEREMTDGDRYWYWKRAELNACVITREKAEELAMELSDTDAMSFRLPPPAVPKEVTSYGIYVIYKNNTGTFSKPFITVNDEYAKESFLERIWYTDKFKLLAIGNFDINSNGNAFTCRNMEEVAIDDWDKHDFMDFRPDLDDLKVNSWGFFDQEFRYNS